MHEIKSIRFKGYKVFSDEQYVEMENISRVNVIIGKNNSGKTSLLDIMETIYNSKSKLKVGYEVEDIEFDMPLTYQEINSVFSGGLCQIGNWDRSNLLYFTENKVFPFRLKIGDRVEILDDTLQELSGHLNNINNTIVSTRNDYRFRKITAERNVHPETGGDLSLQSNGEGASNLIATFLNDSNYDESIIEEQFLHALNLIMKPEAEFENIRVQQVYKKWNSA